MMEANESPEKEDRISALPDTLIHHILSFFPSTKQFIQTGILSKAWKNQWARVRPVLIFQWSGGGACDEDFARFIDRIDSTLLQYECSKIKKFHIAYNFEKDANFDSKLRFAVTKDVEVLCLDFWRYRHQYNHYRLPNFIFDDASLVELEISYCNFELSSKINWPSLKVLKMECCSLGSRLSIENVVAGCPLLESLETDNSSLEIENSNSDSCRVRVASKSLKKLILTDIQQNGHIEISCPNLEKLSLREVHLENKTIGNVLSGSPLLHTLELRGYDLCQLVIVSKSLKKILLSLSQNTVEISCPNLEELLLYSLRIENCKLINLPSSCCVTLKYMTTPPLKDCRKILKELQAFKDLTVGNWFVEILSASKTRHPSYALLNVQCLTLNHPYFERIVGIVNALRCSPALERLVIKLHQDGDINAGLDSKLNEFRRAYMDSNVTGFNCLVSHLKTVKIIGLSKRNNNYKFVLLFIEFLLKNAKVLEKMEVMILKDGGTDFLDEVSRKLLSFPWVSQHAIVRAAVT